VRVLNLIELTLDGLAQFHLIDVTQDEERLNDLAEGLEPPIQRVLLRIGKAIRGQSSGTSGAGAPRRGTAAPKQRTQGVQQRGAGKGLAQVDALDKPGRPLPGAGVVLRGDEDRRPGRDGRAQPVD
jgi:hypothetical protein